MRRTPSYGRHRNTSSDVRGTPDHLPYASPAPSSYSDASSARKSSAVAVAARSVVGVFVGCFTPPETKSSASFADSSEEFKPPSVYSDASVGGNERRRGSGSSRGVYGSTNNSRHERQVGCVKFTMDEIYRATNNFSPSVKIGQGGFGTVYKGRLEDGTLVAIKRAKKSVYDKHLGVEFQSEMQMLSKVEHLNLVKFYGFGIRVPGQEEFQLTILLGIQREDHLRRLEATFASTKDSRAEDRARLISELKEEQQAWRRRM